jgi:hypothetical protein
VGGITGAPSLGRPVDGWRASYRRTVRDRPGRIASRHRSLRSRQFSQTSAACHHLVDLGLYVRHGALGQVHVDERGPETPVPEQRLNGSQMDARLQKMRRIRVPQGVATDLLTDGGLPQGRLQTASHLAAANRGRAGLRGKQPCRRPVLGPIGSPLGQRLLGQRDGSILVALAIAYPHDPPLAIDILDANLQPGARLRRSSRAAVTSPVTPPSPTRWGSTMRRNSSLALTFDPNP